MAWEAVRKSLVLLKNENKTLPISKNLTRIHVSGKSADDMGNQCGGWTIQCEDVADVLFGDHKPTGKLSFSWPKSMDQLPLNINSSKERYEPLFTLGYGLSY